MKLPEPVAWYYTRDTDSAISFAPDRDPEKPWQKLFTESQLTEAIAQQQAVMRQALSALRALRHRSIGADVPDGAIKALEEALK